MRTALIIAAVGLGVAPLAGCGFRPLYAPAGPNAEVTSPIGRVNISLVEGKAGHVLRTELDRLLSVAAGDGPPRMLEIELDERVAGLGLRIDASASRADLTLTATYVLKNPDGAVVLRGRAESLVSYNIPLQAFGEIAAQDDARERAAEVLAQRIRSDLALRMAERPA